MVQKLQKKARKRHKKQKIHIDELTLILTASRRNELAFQIRDCDFETLRLMLEKMVNGVNPNRREEQIAECYIRRKTRLEPGIPITGCKLATNLIGSKHELI